MENILIFAEGKADIKFLKDYISEIYKIPINGKSFIETGGYTALFKPDNIIQMQRNENEGGKNLIIFDTDDDFELRVEYLTKGKRKYEVDFDLFLFPNNANSGNLETLLLKIVNYENHDFYFECFDDFINCLSKGISPEKIKEFEVPDLKAKVFTYLSFFKQDAKEEKRNYKNSIFWNLHHAATKPLKSFLDNYITQL
jgi:hypothetical protein